MPLLDYKGQKLDIDEQIRLLDQYDCEQSLYVFLKKAWKYIDPAPFADGWVLQAIAEHLEAVVDGEIRRLLINIPPRCSKSSIVSVAFPTWVWAQSHISPTSGPGVPLLHASYAHSLALRDSVKRRRLINSPWYQSLWADRFQITPDQNQKIRFQNTKGGESLITSVDAGVTGEGGNIILVDDPNNAKEVLSEATIQSTNVDWWDGTMSTRLNDQRTGAYIVVQQRLGERDLTGHILEREPEEWTHLMLPMEYESSRSFVTSIGWEDPRTEDGELLWPERFGHPEIRKLSRNLGKWKAAGQLQQRPEPAGGGIIKREWWQLWPPEGEPKDDLGKVIKVAPFPPLEYILASLDSAYTEKTMNDPSALTIWGVFASNKTIARPAKTVMRDGSILQQSTEDLVYAHTAPAVVLMHAWQGHLEIHDLVLQVAKLCKTHKVDKLLIENKASGLSVAQELRRLFSANSDFTIQLSDPKGMDKIGRLYSVQHLFEEGLVFAPDRSWSEEVITQVGTFPNARHDDLVDTVSMGLRHLRDQGMLSRSEEMSSEMEEDMRYSGRAPPPLYPS